MTTIIQNVRVRIFGQADWASYYGRVEELDLQVEEILMSACPFNKGKRVLDTHFTFMGMPAIDGSPLTVVEWLVLHPGPEQPKFWFATEPWHAGQPHTDVATLEPRFYIMMREIVPGSTGKTPEQQLELLPPEYEVPSTIAEVTKDILVYRRTGKRSNPNVWAACAERTVKTSRVGAGDVSCVGIFGEVGLYVNLWSGRPDISIGVGASRKILVR